MKTTIKLDGYRVVVSDGYRADVYQGRRKVGHWVVSPPLVEVQLGMVDELYVARVAVDAAKERGAA